jgi:glycosyltransferase involved in cell wall biosynthesis
MLAARAMKLVIQIPCLNEEGTLPQTLRDLPRAIPGIDEIAVLVIDDGSTDRTAEVARECGATRVLRLGTRRGLAQAFRFGLRQALALGADIVVNTDGDNQYVGADVAKLIQPILEGKADMVIGCRPILEHEEFGPAKKVLQLLGSATLRALSKTEVRDAASGFRAFSKEAAQRLFIHTRFSYCMETLIQAGNSGLRVDSVDIRVNRSTRPSRLFSSVPMYIWRSGMTMLAMFVLYKPSQLFGTLAGLCLGGALTLGLRFLVLIYVLQTPDTHRTYLPSLILLSILAVTGVLMGALAVIAQLIRAQRVLTEETLYLLRSAECQCQPMERSKKS